MTKTMNHTNCAHPATKAARAKCRKVRAAQDAAHAAEVAALVESYFHGDGDPEEIIYGLCALLPEVKAAYYGTDADIEELVAIANRP
jgi:hypothetical protein